jgi:hypothetical protein
MGEPQKVLLYGNSLVLAGMEVSLLAYPSLFVMTLDISPEITPRDLCDLRPSVIIFDLATVAPDFPLSLLREQPELMLIGLDAAGDKLLLFSGQQAHTLTTDQLVQMIESLPQAVNSEQ